MRVRLGDTVVRTRPVTLTADRGEGDDVEMRVSGLGVPYETWTTLYDSATTSIREIMSQGLLQGVAEGFQHRRDVVPRDTTARTSWLACRTTRWFSKSATTGFYFTATLNPEDPFARSLYAQVKRQDVRGASIRFMVDDDDGLGDQRVQEGREVVLRRSDQERHLAGRGPRE